MHKSIRFQLIHCQHDIAVEHFTAEEIISGLYTVIVNVVAQKKIEVDNFQKREALLSISGKNGDRHFHGVVNNFMQIGQADHLFTYQLSIIPEIWLLDLNKNYKVFEEVTVVDIVKQIFDDNDITSDYYTFRLESTYSKKRYCTQYGESDFHFISRILQEEGIFFFFEHSEDSHIIVFCDTEAAYSPIEGGSDIGLNPDAGMVAEKATIKSFTHNRAICPGKVTHTNFNFKRPSLHLRVTEERETAQSAEIYEYPGDYGLPMDGAQKAKKHLEEIKSLEESVQGTSNVARFIPGHTFSLSEHCLDERNNEYCLVSVEHEGSQSTVYGEYSGIGGDYTYSNHFVAIPGSKVYRTRKTIEKPYVRGLQTAIVTGPEGQEIYTDEYGRIKVQFHWDREGKKDDRSSCWLRTCQPWSGNGWGFASLPRVGDEVLVGFINGDPDWPIVVGSVNNAASPALYDLPDNMTQCGIRTRSTPGGGPDNFCELRFEDRKGAEEIYLQSERDLNILVKNHKAETVRADSSTTIGGNSTITVQKSSSETAEEITLTANSRITLNCGDSTIVLDPSGIQIHGTIVKVNS